jgi:hypothetical protein
MPDDHLRSAIDSIRAQIQAELETQLGTLERQHADALESARKRERADADQRWTEELNRMDADWELRLKSALDEAAADADRRVQTESDRVFREMDSRVQQSLLEARAQAASSLEQVRAELEQARRTEAEQARKELEQTRADLDQARADLDQARRTELEQRKESEQALVAERSRHAAEQAAHAERIGQLEEAIQAAQGRAQELQTELTVARAQHEQALAAVRESFEAESGRVRGLSSELTAAREALEQTRLAFDTERSAARLALDEERAAARSAAEAQAVRQREAAEARASERQSQLAVTERLLRSVHAIGGANSLTEVLTELVKCAAAEASRAAVLIPREGVLQGLAAVGFGGVPAADRAEGVLETAIREKQRMAITPGAAPAFAALPGDRAGLAVPILVGGQAVALLYADNGVAESPEVPASWPEVVEILCSQASAVLSQLTAMRTTQAMRLMKPAGQRGREPQNHEPLGEGELGEGEEDQAARRYARLLVSEIKLYNESAVRIGREKHDLLIRLRPEVDRARRLYEERVPATVAARARYFEQELRQTLAGGDAALLGDPAVTP